MYPDVASSCGSLSLSLSLSTLARVSVSALLLLAAGLKLREFSEVDFEAYFYFRPPAVITWEIVLALWLIGGIYTRAATCMAIATFASFAGVSFARAVAGEQSCDCFGAIQFSPWITMGVDCTVVVVLARFGSCDSSLSLPTVAVVLAPLCVFFAGLLFAPLGEGQEDTLEKVLPAELRQGTWHITIVRPACLACVAHLHEHGGPSEPNDLKRALLSLGPTQPWLEEFYADFDVHYAVSSKRLRTLRTPHEVLVVNGRAMPPTLARSPYGNKTN